MGFCITCGGKYEGEEPSVCKWCGGKLAQKGVGGVVDVSAEHLAQDGMRRTQDKNELNRAIMSTTEDAFSRIGIEQKGKIKGGPQSFMEAAAGKSVSRDVKPLEPDKTCAGCSKLITDKFVNGTKEFTYLHPECFKCLRCSKAIAGGYVLRGDACLCDGCYDKEKLAQTEANDAKNPYLHKGGGTCSVCNKGLPDRALKVKNKLYHFEHFTCAGCNNKIDVVVSFSELEGKHYHVDHAPKADEQAGGACKACGQAVTGEYEEVGDDQYHTACFVCANCNTELEGVLVKKGKLFCGKKCFRAFSAK